MENICSRCKRRAGIIPFLGDDKNGKPEAGWLCEDCARGGEQNEQA